MGSLNSIRCYFSFSLSLSMPLSLVCFFQLHLTHDTRTAHQPTNQRTNHRNLYRRSLHTSFGVKSNVSFWSDPLPLAYHLTRFTHFIAWFCGKRDFWFRERFSLSLGRFVLWIVYSFFLQGEVGEKGVFHANHDITPKTMHLEVCTSHHFDRLEQFSRII